MAEDAAHAPILALDRVSLRFGGVNALADVSCQVSRGELFSIIGPNGAGKTSMLNCISGRYRPTSGRVVYKGRDITQLSPNKRADHVSLPPSSRCRNYGNLGFSRSVHRIWIPLPCRSPFAS
jgi:ABC-type branched-subunit amino acid transport system ATPase component